MVRHKLRRAHNKWLVVVVEATLCIGSIVLPLVTHTLLLLLSLST